MQKSKFNHFIDFSVYQFLHVKSFILSEKIMKRHFETFGFTKGGSCLEKNSLSKNNFYCFLVVASKKKKIFLELRASYRNINGYKSDNLNDYISERDSK